METTEELEVQQDPAERLEEIFHAFEAKGAVGATEPMTFVFELEGDVGGTHALLISTDGVTWKRDHEGDADVTVKLSTEDFLSIADGNFDGRLAVASERIELSGNLELAECLVAFIEPEEA